MGQATSGRWTSGGAVQSWAQEPGDLRVVDRNRVSAARGGSGAGSVGTQGSREAHRKVFRRSTGPRRSDGNGQALDRELAGLLCIAMAFLLAQKINSGRLRVGH